MQLLTHVLAGWCLANIVSTTPKERALCMGVSLLPDSDGLTLLLGIQAYHDYHHILAHNALFALIGCALLSLPTTRRLRNTLLFLVLFHLHLLMDFYGSGPQWGIAYWWPFIPTEYMNPASWEFGGWQNYTTLAVLLGWTLGIAFRHRRTPLEFVGPRLESMLYSTRTGRRPTSTSPTPERKP